MTTSSMTREYWIGVLLGWAEDRLAPPQFDECKAVLGELLARVRAEELERLRLMREEGMVARAEEEYAEAITAHANAAIALAFDPGNPKLGEEMELRLKALVRAAQRVNLAKLV